MSITAMKASRLSTLVAAAAVLVKASKNESTTDYSAALRPAVSSPKAENSTPMAANLISFSVPG